MSYGTHVSHCCKIHGCKYSHTDCPVANGPSQGCTGSCEDCGLTLSGYYGGDAKRELERELGLRPPKPKWIKFNKTWLDFCNDGLAIPGTLVQVKTDKDKKTFLVGDINKVGGVCDDCMAFENKNKVVKYKVLINKGW